MLKSELKIQMEKGGNREKYVINGFAFGLKGRSGSY